MDLMQIITTKDTDIIWSTNSYSSNVLGIGVKIKAMNALEMIVRNLQKILIQIVKEISVDRIIKRVLISLVLFYTIRSERDIITIENISS